MPTPSDESRQPENSAKEGLSYKPSAVREREQKVMEMLRANYTHREIEEALGYTVGGGAVAQIQKRLYERHIAADVEELRALHMEQLAALDQTYMIPARKGNTKAAEIIHKNQAQRERYFPGLRVPQKIEQDITMDDDTAEAIRLLGLVKSEAVVPPEDEGPTDE